MPERRIILIEGDVHLSDALTNMFIASGNTIVNSVHTVEAAQRIIEDSGPDDFDVAVIDKSRSRDADDDAESSSALVRQLRAKTNAFLVGIASADELADVDVCVDPLDLARLRLVVEDAYIEQLPEAV